MGKPRYPAHVVHLLPRYPAKWCEECGDPILPRLEKPNARYPRVHLEQVTKFKGKRFCSRGCARRHRARAERKARPEPAPDPQPAPESAAEAAPAPIGGVTLDQAAENLREAGKTMREALPSATRLEPRFPTPDGLHASQLTNGGPYARPAKPERPMPTRRQRPKPSKPRPIPDQIADFITGTKGRRITTREIAKAYDLTEPEADTLLGELADEGRIRRRTDPLGRPEYESRHP